MNVTPLELVFDINQKRVAILIIAISSIQLQLLATRHIQHDGIFSQDDHYGNPNAEELFCSFTKLFPGGNSHTVVIYNSMVIPMCP